MSGFPGNNPGQTPFYARSVSSNGASNPLATGLQMPNPYGTSATSSPGQTQPQNFGSPHLQQLTDFHQRQQAMLVQHQRSTTTAPTSLQHIPPQLQQAVQQHQYRAAQQQAALQQLMQAQAVNGSPRMQQQGGISPQTIQLATPPTLASQLQQAQASPRPAQPIQQAQQNFLASLASATPSAPSTPTPQPQAARPASIPVSQAFTPPAASTPRPPAPPQAQVQSKPESVKPVNAPAPAPAPAATTPSAPTPEAKPKRPKKKKKEDKAAIQTVYFAGIEPTTREETPAPEVREEKRERDDAGEGRRRGVGMRGTMRNEVARLMYAAGDTEEPAIDSVDYMEDLLVEFLSDLCRPVPPIRSNPQSLHQPVPLTPAIIRHRLDQPSLRKYLNRFDYMTYMSSTLAEARRVDMPSNEDLVKAVGKEYLGLDAEGGDVHAVKKRRGRPPGGARRSMGVKEEGDSGVPKERKKPGPAKGWKTDPEARERARLRKEERRAKGPGHRSSGGIKVE